jgi:hypothetical protein
MIGIGKNHKALVTIATLASILVVNAMSIGIVGIALARHHDTTKTFENGGVIVQTDTNQGQACETASGTSPISDSCTASSSDTISQGGGVVQSHPQGPHSPCTPTMHPTILTLTLPTTVPPLSSVVVTGRLTDTCTGSGVAGATITFTKNFGFGGPSSAVTDTTGTYTTDFTANAPPSDFKFMVRAHFAGQGIYEPSNSATETFTIF